MQIALRVSLGNARVGTPALGDAHVGTADRLVASAMNVRKILCMCRECNASAIPR
jgi:hypothetical protein